MPRRATSLLDDRIDPMQKKTTAADKRYLAVFLVSVMGNAERTQKELNINAPNRVAAVKIARGMCHNPMIFPPGMVARIPDGNVTELPPEEKLRDYEAVFEVYRKGDTGSRPHLVRKKVSARNRKAAYDKAQEMCGTDAFASASDVVKCPLRNIRIFK